MQRILIVILINALPFFFVFQVGHSTPEKFFQNQWCKEHRGRGEVVLPDHSRCDCLTATHAIEVEFAAKWKNSIGQALHYARLTGKRSGILLILEKDGDMKYYNSLLQTITYYKLPVDVYMWDAIEKRSTIKRDKHQ